MRAPSASSLYAKLGELKRVFIGQLLSFLAKKISQNAVLLNCKQQLFCEHKPHIPTYTMTGFKPRSSVWRRLRCPLPARIERDRVLTLERRKTRTFNAGPMYDFWNIFPIKVGGGYIIIAWFSRKRRFFRKFGEKSQEIITPGFPSHRGKPTKTSGWGELRRRRLRLRRQREGRRRGFLRDVHGREGGRLRRRRRRLRHLLSGR
jgi:hypothetical protein